MDDLEYSPDILKGFDVKEGREFTLRLRKGHKWSDGHPFTAEDFRFYWEDVANNNKLMPRGLPKALMVENEPPKFEVNRRNDDPLHLAQAESENSSPGLPDRVHSRSTARLTI